MKVHEFMVTSKTEETAIGRHGPVVESKFYFRLGGVAMQKNNQTDPI